MHARSLTEGILAAARSGRDETQVSEPQFETTSQNQLLCFLKPEVFLTDDRHAADIISVVVGSFREFSTELCGCLVLSGKRLAETGAIDRHYGFINTMSKHASQLLSESDRASYLAQVGAPASTPVMGGHEFLQRYRKYDPRSLDALWSSKQSLRFRSGLYGQLFEVEESPVVLVNGFHPAQLAHYTEPQRAIALLLVASDLPWRALRTRMLGDTYPDRALPGSIRRVLLDRAKDFGLGVVSVAINCVHLSAGPFEALFEMTNFFGDSSLGFDPRQSRVGAVMQVQGLGELHVSRVLRNPSTVLNGSTVSLYDATEETDTISSVSFYRSHFREGGRSRGQG